MDIGIGLPNTVPGCDREALLDWAGRAEEHGFASLGTLDRLVYPNLEAVLSLTAAAAVTSRIGLRSAVLLGPLREPAALFAKQLATLDVLSGGRLEVGIAVGGREDDFRASGVDMHRRGRILDAQLAELGRIWAGEERGFAGAIGPPTVQQGGPPLLVGGTSDASFRRAARFGAGWISGGGGPESFAAGARRAEQAFADAGRGRPRLAALAYYALGPSARADADRYLLHYYAVNGPYAEHVAAGAAVDEAALRGQTEAFAAAGCDELILFPCSTALEQVDRLAEAVPA